MIQNNQLVASQLLYDLLLDKFTRGACILPEDLLSYQNLIELGCPTVKKEVNAVLRDVLVKRRRVEEADLWALEHILRTCLDDFLSAGRRRDQSCGPKACLELLRQFWEEKAVTGDVLSLPEVEYVEFLLKNVTVPAGQEHPHSLDEQVCPDVADHPEELTAGKPVLPSPATSKQFLKHAPQVTIGSRVLSLIEALVPSKPRRSPRIQKRQSKEGRWWARNLWSHLFSGQ